MPKYLIIVESPTKIKTLRKFLGPQYAFESSIGHIRDLPEKRFGIQLDQRVVCEYEVLPHKQEVVKKLIAAAKRADLVYLCPDPDREGEAIAWHIQQLLPSQTQTKRVTFNAITATEVNRALHHPRELNHSLIEAQQARRVLDRLVGYPISALLAQRVQLGKRTPGQGSLSAGRVQSAALLLVVLREREREAFQPQEYWNLWSMLQGSSEADAAPFRAQLLLVDGKRVDKSVSSAQTCQIDHEARAQQVLERMESARYRVTSIERKEKRRSPVAPFTTSTLQQEAARHHGFSSQRTMSIAQQLYEGIELGSQGPEGLITYMRTDSVRVSPEAEQEVRSYIEERYGKELLEPSVRRFTSSKSAQDAHEAIRPSLLAHPPEAIASHLSPDQLKLYTLIWARFVASQMRPAVYDTVQVDIEAAPGLVVRATGSQIKFRGFLSVYEERMDDDEKEEAKLLPHLQEGQFLELVSCHKQQAFTQPPPRYSEASLVKALEQSGIGRPSTYTSIMNKIQSREYTVKEKGRLKPTELGRVVVQLLETNFSKIMELQFTANMEDELEKVAHGQVDWNEVVLKFWRHFEPALEEAKKSAHVPKIDTDRLCPKCGKHLQKIWAGRGYFFGCSGYPDCDFRSSSEQLEFDPQEYNPNFDWAQPCPKCQAPTKVRFGPYGVFLGCSHYPECRGLINVPKLGEQALGPTDSPCPAQGCSGHLVARKSRFGKAFYACSAYPQCDVIGNSVEQVKQKFEGRPQTPYEKPAGGRAKTSSKKTSPKKAVGKATASKKKAPAPLIKESKTARTSAKSAKGAQEKGALLTQELKELTGQERATHPELRRLLWDYIKRENLQDEKDKRYILCDGKLKGILGGDRVHMMQLGSCLSQHLQKVESS